MIANNKCRIISLQISSLISVKYEVVSVFQITVCDSFITQKLGSEQ